jgi:outer membrane immunogenic protein
MNKRFVIGVAFSVLVGGLAEAADMSAPPPLVSPFTWAGWYIGLNIGYHFNNANDIDTTSANAFAFPGAPGPGLAAAVTTLSNFSAPGGKNGVIGGIQGGYNWQLAERWLVGIEADNDGVSKKGTSGAVSTVPIAGTINTLRQSDSVSSSIDYLGTVRARLGYLFTPTLLLYGTGGLAYGGVNAETGITQTVRGTTTISPTSWSGTGKYSDTRFGWTAGAGFEWMFLPRWTTRVEYLHYDLGTASYNVNSLVSKAPVATPFTVNTVHSAASFSGDIIRTGVNYKF